MVFTTLPFIAFFAIVFFTYYAVPKGWQWKLLLGASWFFYAYASPYYLIFLAITAVATYAGAVWMDTNLARQKAWIKGPGKDLPRDERKKYKELQANTRRWILIGVIAILMGMLGVFKYLSFLVENIAWLGGALGFHIQSPTLNLLLPLGLSFYIFQSLGYCIDVQREEVPAERNFLKHALFVSYFPQLLQGPIGDYGRLSPQLFTPHTFDYEQAVFGLQRVAWGFFKKFMIANTIAQRINPVWGNVGDYPGLFCWAVILTCYAIQLYADFSGYMDIACGCSQMLGIKLDENFSTPYFAKNISDFWRKWHITLGVWFKNYVFYPILRADWNANLRKRFAGSKYLAGTVPTVAALLIVWILIGLWHGADWSYVLYGLYHGSFIMLAVALGPLYDRFHAAFPRLVASKAYTLFQIARTFAIVVLGYSIFKPADLASTWGIWKSAILGAESAGLYQIQYTLHHSFATVCVWIALMFLVDVWHYGHEKGTLRAWIHARPRVVRWALYLAGLWLMVFYGLYGSGFDQFEYFKF